MGNLEISIYIVIVLILTPFIVRKLAATDTHLTFGFENHIKFIDTGGAKGKGGRFSGKMIAEVTDSVFELDPTTRRQKLRRLHPGERVPQKGWLIRYLGAYPFGISPFRSVHGFPIRKQKENPNGTKPEDWLTAEKIEIVYALRETFPRTYVFMNVELRDRLTVNLKITVRFRVIDPYIPVYVFLGDFFGNAGGIIEGAVGDKIKSVATIDDFVEKDKSEYAGLLTDLKDQANGLNQELIRLVGICIDGISIGGYDPADAETIRVIRLKAFKREEGDANIIAAQKAQEVELIQATTYSQQLALRNTADVAAMKATAEARGKLVQETAIAMATTSIGGDVMIRAVSDVLVAESLRDSKVTTLMNGSVPAVALTGGKE